jgi:hypothetical protein
MRKIIFTALGTALMVLSAANAAGAAERHHARRVVQQPAYHTDTDLRDSRAEFAPVYPSYPTYDARAWGGAISAPAGR